MNLRYLMNMKDNRKELLFARIEAFRSLINEIHDVKGRLFSKFKEMYNDNSVDYISLQEVVVDTLAYLEDRKKETIEKLTEEYKNE